MVWSGKSEDCDEFTRNNSEVLGSSIHCQDKSQGIIQEHTK